MSFWAELKKRNVYKIGVAYLIVAWLIAQIVALVGEPLSLPDWFDTVVIVLLAIGFPVALILAWAYEVTPQGLRSTSSVPGSLQTTESPSGIRLNFIVIGLLGLALVVIILDAYVLDDRVNETAAFADPQPDLMPGSVAVLPFENLSSDPADEYYALRMHAEIINQLSKLRSLNVINRDSMLQYQPGQGRPQISDIAEDLGVQSVLSGSFQYVDGRIRLLLELVDPATGTTLWPGSFERDFADVFAVQAEVALSVANALGAELSVSERETIIREPTNSPDAYALYLRATADTGIAAEDRHRLLDEALALDPEFPLAHGAKAWLYSQTLTTTQLATSVDQSDRAELEALITRHAQRALNADSSTAIAHSALGNYHFLYWRWTEAEIEFDAAIELASSSSLTLQPSVFLKAYRGDPNGALRIAEQQRRTNPNSQSALGVLGIAQAWAGQYAEAANNLQTAAALAENTFTPVLRSFAAEVAIARGNDAEALRQLDLWVQGNAGPDSGFGRTAFPTGVAHYYARLGRPEFARDVLRQMEAAAAEGADFGAGTWAQIYVALADYERALEWLAIAAEKARRHEPDEGFYSLMTMKMNINGDPALQRPEFAQVLERITGD